MNDKQSERQRRYRVRKEAQAKALFAHATEIELAWFGVNADGEHIAIDYDGKPVQLIVRTSARPKVSPVDHIASTAELPDTPKPEDLDKPKPVKPKRVYPPKEFDGTDAQRTAWNKVADRLQKMSAEHGPEEGKERAHGWVGRSELQDSTKRKLIAILDALDGDDWAKRFPRFE